MPAAPIEVQVQAKHLQKVLKATPQELYRGMRAASIEVKNRYLSHHRRSRMRGRVGQKGVRSSRGGLQRQFRFDLYGNSIASLKLKMYTRSPVAVLHEKGGIVRPRGRAYMVLPMPKAKDRWGRKTKRALALLRQSKEVAQAASAGFQLRHKGRRVTSKLYAIRRQRDGKIFLVTKQRGSDTLIFWFHLIKSARYKPRLDFLPLWKIWRKAKGMQYYRNKVRYAIQVARKKGGAA